MIDIKFSFQLYFPQLFTNFFSDLNLHATFFNVFSNSGFSELSDFLRHHLTDFWKLLANLYVIWIFMQKVQFSQLVCQNLWSFRYPIIALHSKKSNWRHSFLEEATLFDPLLWWSEITCRTQKTCPTFACMLPRHPERKNVALHCQMSSKKTFVVPGRTMPWWWQGQLWFFSNFKRGSICFSIHTDTNYSKLFINWNFISKKPWISRRILQVFSSNLD